MAAEGKEAYAVFDSNDGVLTFFVDDEGKYSHEEVIGTKTYWTGIEVNNFNSSSEIPWYDYRTFIKEVTIEDEISPISTAYWFYGCTLLASLDLSNLNTSKVINMGHMFRSCTKLVTLDLSNFDTSNVTNMSLMFTGCVLLDFLDLSHFNTSEVTNMEGLFQGCISLISLNLSNFNTSSVANMRYMFDHCVSLTTIFIDEGWDVTNVTNSSHMFSSCDNLPNFNSYYVDKTRAYYGSDGYLTLREAYAKLDPEGTLTFFIDEANKYPNQLNDASISFHETLDDYQGLNIVDAGGAFEFITNDGQHYDGIIEEDGVLCYRKVNLHDLDNVYDEENGWYDENYRNISIIYGPSETNAKERMIDFLSQNSNFSYIYFRGIEDVSSPAWASSIYRDRIKKVAIIDKIYPKTLARWFHMCIQLVDVEGLSNISARDATSMEMMFYDCVRLLISVVDISDTENITNTSNMFNTCQKLTTLDLSSFNMDKVTNMSGMFNTCSSLKNLILPTSTLSSLENISYAFSNCSYLESLDLSKFNFSNITNANRAFNQSYRLKTIIFPQQLMLNGNWEKAFYSTILKQNIIVQSTPSNYTDIFSNYSDLEVYIIWNGDLSTSQNGWPGICQDYSNVHYELDDAAFSADLTKSTRGIYDSTNNEWTTDDGGDYIRFLLNYNVPTTNIPFGFSNTGNVIEFYRRDGSVPTHLDPEQGEIITDPDNSNTYYHEIDSTKLKDNYNYYGVAIIQFSNGTLTLSKSSTTPDVTILGQFAIIDVLPKGHTIALGKVAERIYEAVSSPTGSPKSQGWYELVSGKYVASSDETVVSGKTYYKEAPSLQIGLPMYLPAKGRLYGIKTENGNETNQTIIGINGSNLLHIGASQNTIPVGIYGSNFTLSSAGNLFLHNDKYIYGKEAGGTDRLLIGIYTDNNILIGHYNNTNNVVVRGKNFRVTSGGNATFSGNVTLGGHSSAVGTQTSVEEGTVNSASASTWTTVATITLEKGSWTIYGTVNIKASSNTNYPLRQVRLRNLSTSNTITGTTQQLYAGTSSIQVQAVGSASIAADEYEYAIQAYSPVAISGSTESPAYSGNIRAIRIS